MGKCLFPSIVENNLRQSVFNIFVEQLFGLVNCDKSNEKFNFERKVNNAIVNSLKTFCSKLITKRSHKRKYALNIVVLAATYDSILKKNQKLGNVWEYRDVPKK